MPFEITDIDDPEGIRSIEWDLDGDGRTDATGKQASFSYSEPGDYTVTVTAMDKLEQSTVREEQLTVVPNKPPDARFRYEPRNPKVFDEIQFEAHPTQDDGPLSSFKWDFNEDGTVDARGKTVTHTFETTGSTTVLLTVVDDLGATGTTKQTIQVAPNPPPEARIDVSPTPITTGTEVTFNGSRSTDDGLIATYQWDFNNDGIPDKEGESVKTQFATSGKKSVSLMVIDEKGARSERNVTFYVHARPTADFDFIPRNPHTGDTIEFDASNSTHPNGTIVEYKWDFNGDEKFDRNGKNPTYSFNEPGEYEIQLIVIGDDGISGEHTETISVATEPVCDSTCRMGILLTVAVVTATLLFLKAIGIFDPNFQQRWRYDR